MDRSEATRPRLWRALRLPALLIGMALLLTACVVPVVTPFGDITFVICDYDDLPLEGVLVEIDGRVKTTDEDGYVEFGTVELPFTANLYDPGSNYVASYQNVEDVDLRLFVPFSTDGTSGGSGTFAGDITPQFGGNRHLQAGATVDGNAFRGEVNESSLQYDIGVRWKPQAAVNFDLYVVETEFTVDPNIVPGIINNIAVDYLQGSIDDGENLQLDADPILHPQGTLNGSVTAPNGMDHDLLRYGVLTGSTTMDAAIPFQLFQDDDPSSTFSAPVFQAPSGWQAEFALANYFSNAAGQQVTVSTTGLDFDATFVDVFAAQLGAAFNSYDDGDTFREGDSVNVGSLVADTSVSLRFEPVLDTDLRLWMFSDTGSFTIPDLSVFNVDLRPGAEYHAQTVRYSWPFASLLTKMADPLMLKKDLSIREDLTVLRSANAQVTVGGGGGPPTGGTPPSDTEFFLIGVYERFEGGTIANLPIQADVIAPQASSCPLLSVAATGGTALIDACSGDVIQNYDSAGQTYFDAVIMPIPAGETGNASLFQSGINYFLAALEDDGSLVGFGQVNASGGPFIDSNPIGDDASLGVAYVNAAFASIGFTTFDGASGLWTFADTTLQPSDLNDGGSDNWARSAIVNPAGDAMLVVANRLGSGMQLLYVELDGPIGSGPQAVTGVSVVGALGSDPRRIRCDFGSDLCAVSDLVDNTLTIVAWDGSSAPSITDTANVAAGPVGIDVLGTRAVSAGYNDDQFSVVSLNGDGTVAGVSTTALPSECNFPGHAIFLDDPGNAAIVTCNGDGTPADPGGYVYIPGAF